jgi:hypothetical protein
VQPLSTDPLGSVAGYLVDPADTSYGRLAPLPVMRPYYAGPVAGYLA